MAAEKQGVMAVTRDDGHRPHRFPQRAIDTDAEVVSWRCGACGAWVSEYQPTAAGLCPIDWRSRSGGSDAD